MIVRTLIIGALLFVGCRAEQQSDEVKDPAPSPTPAATGTPAPAPPPPSDRRESLPLELEIEELKSVIRTLADENRRLKEALSSYQKAPPPVTSSFSVTPASPSPSQSSTFTEASEGPETRDAEPVSEPGAPDLATVLYVNPNWHYLVMDQGTEEGFALEDSVEILREGVPIGTAIISGAKPGQSVAEINLDSMGSAGLYPRVTDNVRKQ